MRQVVDLKCYSDAVTILLAEIMNERRRSGLPDFDYKDIPPRDFFSRIQIRPLPVVRDDGSQMTAEANTLIGFVNGTDDILNLKRAINRLLQLAHGEHCSRVFPDERFAPSLLDMSENLENAL
jgi:hypothetical protein